MSHHLPMVTGLRLSTTALQVCHVLLLAASPASMMLVCEEDGTEVDSEEFFMALSDNTVLMALESGQTWKPQPVMRHPTTQPTRAGLLRASKVSSLIIKAAVGII